MVREIINQVLDAVIRLVLSSCAGCRCGGLWLVQQPDDQHPEHCWHKLGLIELRHVDLQLIELKRARLGHDL